jgi:L-lysine exporter family protein LysE/ArgO
MQTSTVFSGFGTGLGLIVAIGAQNVFVLTQGMNRRHLVAVPLICFLCDMVLMSLGIGGVGSFLASDGRLLTAAASGGALFLAWYGLRALRAALSPGSLIGAGSEELGFRKTVAATLAVTLLNPHVYLDCLVLMGSIGSRYPTPDRWFFLSGVLCASFVWFFGLSSFGRLLAPVLGRPRTWRILQAGICALLWHQAVGLGRFAATRIL